MRLAEIVITNMCHIMVSLRSWIGKWVVDAAFRVSARAEIVQVEEVWIDKARINWACVVVRSCCFTLRLGIIVLIDVPIRTGTSHPIGVPVQMSVPVSVPQPTFAVPTFVVPTSIVMRSAGLSKVLMSAGQSK